MIGLSTQLRMFMFPEPKKLQILTLLINVIEFLMG